MEILAKNLRTLRKEAKLSQTEVAEKLGLGYYTLGKWEQGRAEPSADDLVRLADFFEVSTDYLLGRTDELGNIAFTAPTIPAREQQLLADFRSLAPALQEMLLATIETWKGSKANAGTGGKRA